MRRAFIVICLASLILLAGCNWGKGQPILQPTVSISLVLSGNPALGLGQAIDIDATVYDQRKQGVVWAVSPLAFGTVSNETPTSLTYTSPTNFSAPTTVTITATSITNPSITSSVQVVASPLTVSLSTTFAGGGITTVSSPATLNQNSQLFFAAQVSNYLSNPDVTWSLSPASGAGSLFIPNPLNATIVTYTAPPTVSGPTTVTITAASVENPAVTGSVPITVLPSGAGPNVVTIDVNGGPVPGQVHPNAAFTSVTLCNPGSTTACQTVGGILVDTGSSGLRILESQIPSLKLTKRVGAMGSTLENCAPVSEGSYIWGPVEQADIYIGGEQANSVPIQVISSSNAPVPNGCSSGGTTNKNTPQLLGANGILGVGPEPTDCTVAGVNYCDGSDQTTPPNFYYACPSIGCAITDSPVVVSTNQQIANPIPLTSNGDTNGVILQLPPVSSVQAAVSGLMTFGIGTEGNNALGGATVFTLDSKDHFTTTYRGQSLTGSLIDSGSNALYFPDSLPVCGVNTKFFCPSSLTNLSAVNQGATQGQSTVQFSVDNADNLFSAYPDDAVFSVLAGPMGTYNSCSQGTSCTFVWGLPFFYGRTVFTAIDGQTVVHAPKPPWWAY